MLDRCVLVSPEVTMRAIRIFIAEAFAMGIIVLTYAIAPTYQSAPVAVGMAAFTANCITGPVSQAHFNPAVTFAEVLLRRIGISWLPVYWFGQFLGALATLYTTGPLHQRSAVHNDTATSLGQIMSLEVITSFWLVLVVISGSEPLRPNAWSIRSGMATCTSLSVVLGLCSLVAVRTLFALF